MLFLIVLQYKRNLNKRIIYSAIGEKRLHKNVNKQHKKLLKLNDFYDMYMTFIFLILT